MAKTLFIIVDEDALNSEILEKKLEKVLKDEIELKRYTQVREAIFCIENELERSVRRIILLLQIEIAFGHGWKMLDTFPVTFFEREYCKVYMIARRSTAQDMEKLRNDQRVTGILTEPVAEQALSDAYAFDE